MHKWLVNQLEKLGFSISHNKVIGYKQSVIKSMFTADSGIRPYPKVFAQWIAVNHNVRTLNGKNSFGDYCYLSTSERRIWNFLTNLEEFTDQLFLMSLLTVMMSS